MRFEHILSSREKQELRGEVFRDRDLVGVDLSGADLRDARFENVQLVSCNLAGADLRSTQFVLCVFRDVVLSGALLGENLFYGTTLTEIGGLAEDARREVERTGGAFSSFTSAR
jgi:uncharacterized protein YjbI with pentapeptide repeats